MAKTKKLFLAFFLLLLGGVAYFWVDLPDKQIFKVSQVVDGDTFHLSNGDLVRLIGIDAPEPDDCFGPEAGQALKKLIEGKKIKIEKDINQKDRFGRWLVYAYLAAGQEEIFINEFLLGEGKAVFFLDLVNQRYQASLIAAAEIAREQKKGLWSFCAPDPQAGCLIKGNIDRLDQRWYHLPYFRHYQQTQVNLDEGDRWFCTEKQAEEAGFQRARE